MADQQEDKFLRDDDGSILRFANGRPVLKDMFCNDPMDPYWSYFDAGEIVEFFLKVGVEVPEYVLEEKGFRRVDGEWIAPDADA